jgi:tetratricopeptide (TPR) repeat protein
MIPAANSGISAFPMLATTVTSRPEETGLDYPIHPSRKHRVLHNPATPFFIAIAFLISAGCAARTAALLNKTGLEQYRHERYDQAYESFSEAIALSPGSAELYYNRAGSAEKLARLRDAQADLTKAIELEPKYVDAYIRRAGLSFDRSRFESARADWSSVLSLSPDNADAYLGRGRALERLERTDEARPDFDRAVILSPSDSFPLISRGRFFFGIGSFEQAIADFTSATSLSPKSPEPYLYRGVVYEYGLLRPDEALADYTRAVEISPKDPYIRNYRASLLRKLGRTKEALADFSVICHMGYPFGCWQYDWLKDEKR